MQSIKHFTTKIDEENRYRVYSLDQENNGQFRLWIMDWIIVSIQDSRGSLLTWDSFDKQDEAILAYNNYIDELES